MRSADSWLTVIHPAAHLGVNGELERQIKRIQADALYEAAGIAHDMSIDKSMDAVRDEIESKAKALDPAFVHQKT